jgi:hypothetical protein
MDTYGTSLSANCVTTCPVSVTPTTTAHEGIIAGFHCSSAAGTSISSSGAAFSNFFSVSGVLLAAQQNVASTSTLTATAQGCGTGSAGTASGIEVAFY